MSKVHIHQEIWDDIRRPFRVLMGHFIVLVLILLEIWAIIELSILLFSDEHIVILILLYISDVAAILLFAKITLWSLLQSN